jgi:hypothetical protein
VGREASGAGGFSAMVVVAAGVALGWLAVGPGAAPAQEWTQIFGGEPWYRSGAEPERTWQGTLRRRDVVTGPNTRTALRYALATDTLTIPVYGPQSTDRLEPFVDARVLVRGKLVDLSAEGFGTELWPGSIARIRR